DSYQDLIDKNDGDFYPFRPGMSATVDIQTETRLDVITVPIQAVTTRIKKEGGGTVEVKDEDENEDDDDDDDETVREEKQEVVFVLNGDRVKKVEVTTGIQDNTDIEILKGITSGDEVIIAPYNAINNTLKDSMKVKVVKEDDLYKSN
ncbi:MAG: efflux transporter periplasmic adaptor subunit, partial [Mariniphaga sp.]|nr:efflux transporter periplasmic adaptor subunit [Mariniphaga sp.]